MKISKAMILGWIQLAMGLFSFPQFVAVVPEALLPWLACASGLLTLVFRWLNGGLGVNPLTGVGVLILAEGILAVPELLAKIPLDWMPALTIIGSVLTILGRYYAGKSKTDPALPVAALVFKAPA